MIVVWLGFVLGACSPGGSVASSPSPSPSPAARFPSPAPTSTPLPQQVEAPLPQPRQEVAEGSLAPNSLWVIGGFDPERRSSTSVQIYLDQGWGPGPSYPLAVDHAAAADANGRLYVAGGYSNGGARGDLFRLDSSLAGWDQMAPMHHPRGALSLVALGTTLYALGGAAGSAVAPVEAYDTVQNTWTDVTTLPLPRDHGAGFAWRGLACVAGGRFPTSARVDCYSPSANAWSRLPDLPVATAGAGATTLGGQVIVAGGENAAESTLVNHVFRFGGGTTWTDESMLVPRHGVQLAVFGGRAWACGGANAPGYRAAADCTSIA